MSKVALDVELKCTFHTMKLQFLNFFINMNLSLLITGFLHKNSHLAKIKAVPPACRIT